MPLPAAAPLNLPGSANDYSFEVISFGDSAADTVTRVRSVSDSVPSYSADIAGIGEVTFGQSVDNDVAVTDDVVALEMITLAQAAYAAKPNGSTFHDAFPLAYENAAGTAQRVGYATDAATARGWHALSAAELDMAAADFGTTGALKFSMQGGFYQAIQTDDTIDGDPSEANAVLFTGVVDGKTVLTISFTGTDELADTGDYGNFDDHYEKFAPLVEAVKGYIDDASNGIDQVLVSGHSLGAAMVQYFMDEFDGDDRFLAWTAGSPGADNETREEDDPRTTNFIEWDDPVTYAPLLSDPAVRALVEEFVADLLPNDPDITAIIDALIDAPLTKFRNGTDIYVDPGDAVPHEISGYLAAIKEYYEDGAEGADELIVLPNADGGENVFALSADALKDYEGTDGRDEVTFASSEDLVLADAVEDAVIGAGPGGVERRLQTIEGNDLDNRIVANGGPQEVYARGGDDVVKGGAGRDVLIGNGGDDRLIGGDSSDVLKGMRGADDLFGGDGADRFVFGRDSHSAGDSHDRILDFDGAGGDRIDLSDLHGPGGRAPDLTFIDRAAFGGEAGEVRQFAQDGGVMLEADLDGDGTADFAVYVRGVERLGADDILL